MLEPPLLVTFAVSQVFGLLAVIFIIVAIVEETERIRQISARHFFEYEWQEEDLIRFLWHPALMSVGLVYLFGSSAVIYRVLRVMSHFHVKLVHAGIHAAALVFALTGLTFVVQYKQMMIESHFTTIHGLFGLMTVILFATQWIISIPVFLWPNASDFIQAPGLAVHVCLGIAVFLSAVITTFTGLYMKSNLWQSAEVSSISNYYVTSAFFYLFYVLCIFFMVLVKKYEKPVIETSIPREEKKEMEKNANVWQVDIYRPTTRKTLTSEDKVNKHYIYPW